MGRGGEGRQAAHPCRSPECGFGPLHLSETPPPPLQTGAIIPLFLSRFQIKGENHTLNNMLLLCWPKSPRGFFL